MLITQTTRDPDRGLRSLRDLGEHRLKDLSEPQHLYQLGFTEFPPLKTLDATNLPIVATALLDRKDEVRELVSLLSNGSRLVTVTGPGGTGKSRLALQVAAELVGDAKDGVFWVPLADLSDSDLVMPTIAQALGAREVTVPAFNREALLLLDNAEHLLSAAPSLAELLTRAPRLRLLVTSRAPLRVSGEREYPLAPLPDADAIELFVERARAVGREVQPNGSVAAICRRLDGLPLAVELAAARTKFLDPESLLLRLEHALPLLTGGPRDAPERQRTLRAAIEWSYQLLDEQTRAIFSRLGVFVGSCSLEAAEEVCGADLDELAALVDLSLLKPVGSDRFLMLQTIREYALELLEAQADAEELHERHARTFTALVEQARFEVRGSERARWEVRLETELPNIRAALAWAGERHPELLHRIVVALRIFWTTHGYLREGRSWLERALETGVEGLERAEILGGLGWICHAMGDREAAAVAAEERLTTARELGDAKNESGALGLQAVLAEERGDLGRAEEILKTRVAISRTQGEAGRPERRGIEYAEFLLRQDRHGDASDLLGECLASARTRGDTFLVGRCLGNLGWLALIEGRRTEALELLAEGVRLLAGLGERYGTVFCIPLIAEILADLGEAEKSARLVAATIAQLEKSGLELWAVGVRRREETLANLRVSLGEARFAALYAEGAAMSFDEVVEYALDDLPV